MTPAGNLYHSEQGLAFQRGCHSALSYFFHEFYPALTLFAYRWTKSRPIAEEIASEAFVKAWRMHRKLDSYAGIRSYLYKIVQRDCQRISKKKVKEKVDDLLSGGQDISPSTPFQHLVRTETYRLLHAAIQSLSPGNRKVITMHFLDGKTTGEIARELNLHPHTVQTQKSRGLKALRKVIPHPFLVSLYLLVKLFLLSL